jgi:uncharacterized protein (DUF1330 family)
LTVYCIALINIADREKYSIYERGFREVFRRYSGTMLAADEAPTVREGGWPYTRTVLISFPDAAAFSAWYDSSDYQEIAQHRYAASTASLAVIKGPMSKEPCVARP